MHLPHQKPRGFSLLELAIAVAVISLLIALAWAGFGTMRGKARAAECLGNLQAHVVAARLFAQDNGGLFPGNSMRNQLRGYMNITDGQADYDTTKTCPASQAAHPTRHYMHATYAMNQCLTSTYDGEVVNWQKVRQWTKVPEPSKIYLFMDGPINNYNSAGFANYGPMARPGRSFVYPHSGGIQIAYADGHLEWMARDDFLHPDRNEPTREPWQPAVD